MPANQAELELAVDSFTADPDDYSDGGTEEASDLGEPEMERDIENSPPPNKAKKAEDDGDEGSEDSDGAQTHANLLDEKGKLRDDETKKDRRKLYAGLLLIAILLFLIILGLVFGTDSTPSNIEFGTIAPTLPGPTETPTAAPTGDSPPEPTPFPTTGPPTTLPPFPTISALPCEQIRLEDEVTGPKDNFLDNFPSYPFEGKEVCGDTYGGFDDERPNWSMWTIRLGRRDCPASDIIGVNEDCERVGSRLCTEPELRAGVAQGTGCGGDRGFVWTQTPCTSNGENGYLMFDFGLRDSKGDTKCETDLSVTAVTRCCGDNY